MSNDHRFERRGLFRRLANENQLQKCLHLTFGLVVFSLLMLLLRDVGPVH